MGTPSSRRSWHRPPGGPVSSPDRASSSGWRLDPACRSSSWRRPPGTASRPSWPNGRRRRRERRSGSSSTNGMTIRPSCWATWRSRSTGRSGSAGTRSPRPAGSAHRSGRRPCPSSARRSPAPRRHSCWCSTTSNACATRNPSTSIVALAAHLPDGSQIAIATRSMEGLPIPRLMAAERLMLLERDDLRLDDEEAMALLSGTGRRRSLDEVRELNAAAEGWPAGLYLMALTTRAGDGGSDGPAAALPAGHGLVDEYLRTELLDRLSDQEVSFLRAHGAPGASECAAVRPRPGEIRLRQHARSARAIEPVVDPDGRGRTLVSISHAAPRIPC